jgi:16S rRNA G966 N2-methylase RsmD
MQTHQRVSFADFILLHEGDDPVRLLLSRDKLRDLHPDLDIDLAVTTLEVRRKLKNKVPEWYSVPSLIYPFRLSGEQCSSSETAKYKALVASRLRSEGILSETASASLRPLPPQAAGPSLLSGRGWPEVSDSIPSLLRVADLTGGMGVDTWAFSQVAEEVLYNEMNEELAKATELNFRELNVDNVRFGSRKVEVGKVQEVLDEFEADVIFLDPARRAEDGRKVFLIEECQPDVVGLLPELFAASRYVMVKLSPMADIAMACKRLEHVREVHVVASGGECKELLFVLDREWEGEHSVVVFEGGAVMEIPDQVGNDGFEVKYEVPKEGDILFEPGKALTKAGAFNLPCERFGMTKLGIHTHLYTSEAVPEGLEPFGKWFQVLAVWPLNNRSMKEAGKRYPQAEVTARNIPMTSDLLRKKIGCASGGEVHLFGVRIDAAEGAGNYLIETKRIDK